MRKDPRTPVADALVDFVLRLELKALPDAVIDAAGLCLTDWIGAAIRGSTEPLAAALDAVIGMTGGDPQATIVGRGRRTSALLAALANGAQGHALDFDDTHLASIVHGSAPVAPVVLALAEWRHRPGPEAIAAFVAGFEIETRIGRVIGPTLADRGWHVTAMLGHFGAVAAAGKLLGLTAPELGRALGIAGTQAAGLEQSLGTMCKPLHPGQGGDERAPGGPPRARGVHGSHRRPRRALRAAGDVRRHHGSVGGDRGPRRALRDPRQQHEALRGLPPAPRDDRRGPRDPAGLRAGARRDRRGGVPRASARGQGRGDPRAPHRARGQVQRHVLRGAGPDPGRGRRIGFHRRDGGRSGAPRAGQPDPAGGRPVPEHSRGPDAGPAPRRPRARRSGAGRARYAGSAGFSRRGGGEVPAARRGRAAGAAGRRLLETLRHLPALPDVATLAALTCP